MVDPFPFIREAARDLGFLAIGTFRMLTIATYLAHTALITSRFVRMAILCSCRWRWGAAIGPIKIRRVSILHCCDCARSKASEGAKTPKSRAAGELVEMADDG